MADTGAEDELYTPKLKSNVWKYFKLSRVIKEKAFCSKCRGSFQYKAGCTSYLSKHLLKIHGIDTRISSTNTNSDTNSGIQAQSSSASNQYQPTVTEFVERKKCIDLNSHRGQEITKRIVMMVCKDLQPFSVVEDSGFLDLIAFLEPRFVMPSRKYITQNVMPKIYDAVKKKLLVLIRESDKCYSLTTDAWTSCATQSYVTVTCHMLNDDWIIDSYVLCTHQMSMSLTAANIASHLLEVSENWGLHTSTKTIYVTTDNASSELKGEALHKYQTVYTYVVSYAMI